jgi:hypothetical protein
MLGVPTVAAYLRRVSPRAGGGAVGRPRAWASVRVRRHVGGGGRAAGVQHARGQGAAEDHRTVGERVPARVGIEVGTRSFAARWLFGASDCKMQANVNTGFHFECARNWISNGG